MNLRRLLGAVLTASLLAACGDDADNRREIAGADLIRLGDQVFADHGTVDARGRDELRMEAGLFYFEPTFVRGAPGQQLTLNVYNDDEKNDHTFMLPAQGIRRDIPPNQAERIEVTFPQSGVLLFFCAFHATQGMKGELLAGDASPQPAP